MSWPSDNPGHSAFFLCLTNIGHSLDGIKFQLI